MACWICAFVSAAASAALAGLPVGFSGMVVSSMEAMFVSFASCSGSADLKLAGLPIAEATISRSVVNAERRRKPCSTSIAPTPTRSRGCTAFFTKFRAASCARASERGAAYERSKRSMKFRRAAGGIGVSGDCFTLKSIASKEVMARSFPWSKSLKFALVRPRTALPLPSTTVTGTSTTLTLMLSFNCANAVAQQSAAATVTTLPRIRIRPPVNSRACWRSARRRSCGPSHRSAAWNCRRSAARASSPPRP